ncbi:MAG TPA: hypothetical protein VMB05_06455 [Solirubrobacteraceae bacterium]|nr:hypothetical protein [Solirubrobacteraceae bacterium]
MQELIPGLFHWSAHHDGIGATVYSSFLLDSATLLDPMEPPEGIDAIAQLGTPQRIVLSNRHHYRHSARFIERFDCPVLCHEAGLYHFDEDQPVEGFSFGEQLDHRIWGLELGAICPEETTLLLDAGPGALSFGDGLTRDGAGQLAFMPDRLLGEDPERVRAGLRANLTAMLDERFDALLFAHADPVLSGGHELLRRFLES